VDLTQTVFEVIDMRSFSNLWYWIALAVLWSSTSHWVLGVPFDMIQRARRQGGQTVEDVELMASLNSRRLLGIARTAAAPLFAFVSFILTTLAILGFWFGVEFAQAVFFLAAPMVIVGWLALRSALRIEEGESSGDALFRLLVSHRRKVQAVGMFSILVTSLFGMYQNFNVSVLN
jgi:hypothetical protein